MNKLKEQVKELAELRNNIQDEETRQLCDKLVKNFLNLLKNNE